MPLFSSILELTSASLAAGTALAGNRYIQGSFKSYNDIASYEAESIDRFETGQIIYVTSSRELFEVTVHPPNFVDRFEASSSIESFEFPANTGSFLVTASVSSNVITFTKGDNTNFDLIVNTGSGAGAGFPFTGSADIFGNLQVERTTGFTDRDLLIIKGEDNEGSVNVNQQGVLNLKWSGSAPPTVVEGGLYYSSSALYVGI